MDSLIDINRPRSNLYGILLFGFLMESNPKVSFQSLVALPYLALSDVDNQPPQSYQTLQKHLPRQKQKSYCRSNLIAKDVSLWSSLLVSLGVLYNPHWSLRYSWPKGVLEKIGKVALKLPFPSLLVNNTTLYILKFFISFQNSAFDFFKFSPLFYESTLRKLQTNKGEIYKGAKM